MKFYEKYYDKQTKHHIRKFLGIKIKVKDNNSPIYAQIQTIHKILNAYLDISKYPQAQGSLREQQLQCLYLLNIVDKICKTHNLTYWLEGGTLLGAYRHRGFIPWDNDIDICMPRTDYNIILELLKNEFLNNEEFFVRERAITLNYFQIRIRHKLINIGMDIFPVDSYYKSHLEDSEMKKITKDIKHCYEVFNKKYPNKYLPIEEIPNAKKDLAQIRDTYIMQNKPIAKENPALFYGIDFPYNNAKGNLIMPYDIVYPLNSMIFENKEFPVPNRSDLYLKNLYEDYMKFPKIF